MNEPSLNAGLDGNTSLESLIAVAVGNSRTQIGSFLRAESTSHASLDSHDTDAIVKMIKDRVLGFEGVSEPAIVIAGVQPAVIDAVQSAFAPGRVVRLGVDLPIDLRHTLSESGEKTVGQDRLLCAIGAFHLYKQACVVVDAGTAITVDFVDGEGVFHGGAILPGITMMLASLHEKTAALPKLKYTRIDASSNEPGRQTDTAMMLGVTAAACGAVRWLTERYAEFYEGYPKIVATGGDMGIFEDDELVETFVPDLQLIGLRVACERALQDNGDEE
ncbi:MAG: type III pantothenate kinase [Phycisphaerales bacterium]|nr:type III pantothenate kinase [Phycisphaerales bacterium]